MLNKKKVGHLEILMEEMSQETLIHRLTEREENISDNTVPEDSRQMVAKVWACHEQAWEG